MRFSTDLCIELCKHNPKENRSEVASSVYSAMVAKGYTLAIVNGKGFQQEGSDRTYWMRRNNRVGCWEIA